MEKNGKKERDHAGSRWKQALSAVCFCALLFAVLFGVGRLLERKTSRERYEEFWGDPGKYDVWLLGTSHVYHGINPMELWEDYGAASYNLASPSNRFPQLYWLFQNALQYGTPKLVVVDTYHAGNNAWTPSKGSSHIALDSVPLSVTKVEAICDLFETAEDRMEFLCDFLLYHNRWEELGRGDIKVSYNKMKGTFFKKAVEDQSSFELPAESEMLEEGDILGYQYLRLIIDECKERKIPLLLTAIPSCESRSRQMAMNRVKTVAEEKGVPFLNIAYLDNPVDYSFDFGDKAHLNPSGMDKMTQYLGNYIQENFDLPDRGLEEGPFAEWEADYETYRKYKASTLKSTKKLSVYLALLRDDRYKCSVCVGESADFAEKEQIQALLENVSHAERITGEEMRTQFGKKYVPDETQIAIAVYDVWLDRLANAAVFSSSGRVK